MADKTIGELPKATSVNDDSKLLMEQGGEAMYFEGKIIKDYVAPYATSAQNAAVSAQSAYAGVKEAIENIPEGAATPIVNDLTTGGTQMALSAEMGKEIANQYYNLDRGTAIPSGANLDEYLTLGSYYSASSTITASLTNPPALGAGFKLVVERGYLAAHRIQRAVLGVASRRFVRYYANSAWGEWKEAATTGYAVNKAGDTMTGSLRVETSNYPTISAYNTTPGRYTSITMGDVGQAVFTNGTTGDSGNRNCLIMNKETTNLRNMLVLYPIVDGKGTGYSVLHAGNKPSGSYTGNGDATERTIDTGGVGNAVIISSSKGMALLSRGTALACDTVAIEALSYSSAHFENGVITLATDHENVNANGITYKYQVL